MSEREHGATFLGARGAAVDDDGSALVWRCVGPHRGGRVVAVAGDPDNSGVFYHGACAGGVWKTTDAGTYWENVSDGFFGTAAVGAIAVAPSDPNVVYVGTGETTIRSNVSHGDGVYRSTDGGRTWKNLGLADTRHIAKIRIHPRNPDHVYVAALGHAWGPNAERGVFRSLDGGTTWARVLFESDRAGAIDLAMDPSNPRILFAATWEAARSPYSLSSGGPGSKLHRSTDGGETWIDVSSRPGFPSGVRGKIGVAVSPGGESVWALVESRDGALLRSNDGGESWKRVSEDGELRMRAWYYTHVVADPSDPDTVWVLNLQCWKSIDGGQNFVAVPTPHGDNHDLWIDPSNSQRMIEGNDGGACVSLNGGKSWSSIYNQPTAQMYHVTTDRNEPYRVYGSQQDNSAISIASMSRRGAITPQDWYEPGGGESGYIAVNPDNPNIVYGGAIGSGDFNGRLIRYDHATDQEQDITVWPYDQGMGDGADTLKYRFQWTFPLSLSPHDSGVLYAASNKILRSDDEGKSWSEISPDLTRADPATLASSGGPITQDNTGAEVYGTVFAFAESEIQPGVFWAGSDDGLVHVSTDAGKTWSNVTPPDLPPWSLITSIEPSHHDHAAAYLCATRYKHDDLRPYLFKTSDLGATWTSISAGIPDHEFTRILRADPAAPGLLFSGTETGLYVSFDDGDNWRRMQGNLPTAPIYDVTVRDNELIAATHGRSFWVLDDISPLRSLTEDNMEVTCLFAPAPARRLLTYQGWGYKASADVSYRHVGTLVAGYRSGRHPDGTLDELWLDAGKNPPIGVSINYYLAEVPSDEISLSLCDQEGTVIRTLKSRKPASATTAEGSLSTDALPGGGEGAESAQTPAGTSPAEDLTPRVPAKQGLNRFVWDMRHPDAESLPGDTTLDPLRGPMALPGHYTVKLSIAGESLSESFEILPDPRSSASAEDLQAQFTLALQVRDDLSRTHRMVRDIRGLTAQLDSWIARLDTTSDTGIRVRSVRDSLATIENALVQRDARSPLNPPSRLNSKLAALLQSVQSADSAPTRGQQEVYSALSDQVAAHTSALSSLVRDIETLNAEMRSTELGPIWIAPNADPDRPA